ncbi:hypothetical protein AYL99_06877 [Fonsecaea erecta]|uniref:Metallo-beta-lactamase domain-containing protein n=1 Tax=Fonsecaea erecta TaxID=1367422 RepID=A0A178ZIG1_9EURO|nr:hypothetical protein AYL99_06877 [Fonsecaea erecta]OAP59579.1 hypothetical protein AYL99_06877 [Fonsecaea erecta]
MASTRISTVDIPKSDNCVRVRMIDAECNMTLGSEHFFQPTVPGHEIMYSTDVAFLIDNPRLGKKAMFDLGTRKDWWKQPPMITKRLGTFLRYIKVDRDVTEILEAGGVELKSINDIIWSHYHFDHTGSTYLFPKSTNLIYGPGTTDKLLPPYPDNPRSPIAIEHLEGRKCIEVTMETWIGSLPAHDFYGDGSLYLLDTPGHAPGHVCALARTTPDTFIFMGGDVCHFAGDFRPSEDYPMPDPIPEGALYKDALLPTPCPCSFFTDHHPRGAHGEEARKTPWYEISRHKHSSYADPELASRTVQSMAQFDARKDVLVCLAHETMLPVHLPTFQKDPAADLNAWQEKAWKARVDWGWLNELPRNGKQARKDLPEGFYRDGKLWETARKELGEMD